MSNTNHGQPQLTLYRVETEGSDMPRFALAESAVEAIHMVNAAHPQHADKPKFAKSITTKGIIR